MIDTNYCYKLLLQIGTEARNQIIPGFGEGEEKGTGTTPLVNYFPKPQNILKLRISLPPGIYYLPDHQNTYYIYTLLARAAVKAGGCGATTGGHDENILAAAGERRQRESKKCGRGEGGEEESISGIEG